MDGRSCPSAWLNDADDADLKGSYLDASQHVAALATLSRRLRQRGDGRAAFAFADRCCRLTHQRDALALLLRAEASEHIGDEMGYHTDIESVFSVDPLLPEAARHILATGSPQSRNEFARVILANPRAGHDIALDALDVLLRQDFDLITDVSHDGICLSGRLAWRASDSIEIELGPASNHWVEIVRDPLLWPNDRGIALARLPSDMRLDIGDAATAIECLRGRSRQGSLRRLEISTSVALRTARPVPSSTVFHDARLTVVLPVFGNRRMSQLCLLALLRQRKDVENLRIVVVDDNPDASILTGSMSRLMQAHGIEVLRNERNLGFALSVNRALAATTSGDVLLLNADVILPPGAVSRLQEAACGAPDIGTVTPLSNNGEEVSFPSAFYPAPFVSVRAVSRIDRAAASANGASVVDIVNGVGFCLYVTRRALEAVGELPLAYGRGYYEDVDFTLAVRNAGLRNVCATGVYVGHRGASSFGPAKSALVARNGRILAQRYPTYAGESAAFLAADPLRPARAAMERLLTLQDPASKLLLLAPHEISKGAVYRRALDQPRCLCLSWLRDGSDTPVLWMSDGSLPQSLRFEGAKAIDELMLYLHDAGVADVDVVGQAFESRDLIQRLDAEGFAVELVFDDSLLRIGAPRDGVDCDVEQGEGPCRACIEDFLDAPVRERAGAPLGLDAALKVTRRVRPMNQMARAVANYFHLKGGAPVERQEDDNGYPRVTGATTLGVLAREGDPAAERLVHLVATTAARRQCRLVVLGSSFDAGRLMSIPNVFVTGPVAEDELRRLLPNYGVDLMFAPSRWSGFGEIERNADYRAAAYFDWSGGLHRKRSRDLALDPRVCDRKVVSKVDRWWRAASSDGG